MKGLSTSYRHQADIDQWHIFLCLFIKIQAQTELEPEYHYFQIQYKLKQSHVISHQQFINATEWLSFNLKSTTPEGSFI